MTARATLAALLVLVGTLGAACGDDGGSASGSGSTSNPPSTSTAPSSSTASGGTGTTTSIVRGGGTILTADDAVLVAPAGGRRRNVIADSPCDALAPGGRCGAAGPLAWVFAPPDLPDRSPVTIYRIDDDEMATPVLVVEPGAREEHGAVEVQAANLDGRPGDELVVGLRNAGTGALLQLEIVDRDGTVAAHVTLDRGRAALGGGVLRTWAARYLPDDPNCCPSRFDEAVVLAEGGRWRTVPQRQVAAEDVPEGDFS